MAIHSSKACIELISTNNVSAPFHKVILEDPLVKLVQNVRREAGEYIATGERFPEWVIDCS
jgi:hypothetical protein